MLDIARVSVKDFSAPRLISVNPPVCPYSPGALAGFLSEVHFQFSLYFFRFPFYF